MKSLPVFIFLFLLVLTPFVSSEFGYNNIDSRIEIITSVTSDTNATTECDNREALLGNGSCQVPLFSSGAGDITAVNPFDASIIINNSASGDVYVQVNETRINNSASALDNVINETQRAWADANFIDIANEGVLNVNSSDFLDTAQGTITNVNSTEFNVTSGVFTIYLQWLIDFILDNSVGGDDNFFDQSLNTTDNVTFFNVTSQNFIGNINASFVQNNNWIEDTQESSLNVNSSDFLDTPQGTISGVNSTEFNVTTGTLTLYNQWLDDFITDIVNAFGFLTSAVEKLNGDVYLNENVTTGSVGIVFNETRLNNTINAFLGNGTFGAGSGDITAVNPFDISIIINNSASDDVYVQVNETRINDSINVFLGNGTFGSGSGDITAVNPFDESIIINNSASGDVYVQSNETRINNSASALDDVINETQRAWVTTNFIDFDNESSLNVNSSDFLNTVQGTITNVNSTEFNVTTGTLTIYLDWLSDFITDVANGLGFLTTAVESIRSSNTFISYNASTEDVETTFNETRLNDTINVFLGNGTFGGAGDITAVNPFDASIIINNSASGDVYVQVNETRGNNTINSFLGNGTFTGLLRDDGDTATGNYTFDNPTFFIDSNNNRVSFGTLTGRSPLTVKGNLNVTDSSTSSSGIIFHNGTGICIGACS